MANAPAASPVVPEMNDLHPQHSNELQNEISIGDIKFLTEDDYSK